MAFVDALLSSSLFAISGDLGHGDGDLIFHDDFPSESSIAADADSS
jgi:L-fucose mutarotase/ribose pyranase (RbsD/FucU family)